MTCYYWLLSLSHSITFILYILYYILFINFPSCNKTTQMTNKQIIIFFSKDCITSIVRISQFNSIRAFLRFRVYDSRLLRFKTHAIRPSDYVRGGNKSRSIPITSIKYNAIRWTTCRIADSRSHSRCSPRTIRNRGTTPTRLSRHL